MNFVLKNIFAFNDATKILAKNWYLTFVMARRDITDRYIGQSFGIFWTFGHPLFLMGLYAFVFTIVFNVKVGGTFEMPLDYTTYLFSGLIVWLSLQESLIKSCSSITGNSSLVKQVVFPLEILPVKGVLSSLFQQGILLIFLVFYVFFKYRYLPWTYSLLPVLIFFQLMLMIGLSFLLSSIGAYFRDLKDFVQLFTVAGVYLLPIVYLPKWVPEIFRPLLYLNPFSYLVWCYQDVLYFGRIDHPYAWIINILFSIFVFIFGYRVFRKLKPMFGNVL
jgi:lipopolysaccharide transport system permease protein